MTSEIWNVWYWKHIHIFMEIFQCIYIGNCSKITACLVNCHKRFKTICRTTTFFLMRCSRNFHFSSWIRISYAMDFGFDHIWFLWPVIQWFQKQTVNEMNVWPRPIPHFVEFLRSIPNIVGIHAHNSVSYTTNDNSINFTIEYKEINKNASQKA